MIIRYRPKRTITPRVHKRYVAVTTSVVGARAMVAAVMVVMYDLANAGPRNAV